MTRGIVLYLQVEPDYDDPDAMIEDLEVAVDGMEDIILIIAGHHYHAEITAVEAEPWTAKVTSAQIFGG